MAHTGRIKKIVYDRGFGFISARDGREIFFHQNSLIGIKLTDLRNELEVEFDVEKSWKGPSALNVRIVQQV